MPRKNIKVTQKSSVNAPTLYLTSARNKMRWRLSAIRKPLFLTSSRLLSTRKLYLSRSRGRLLEIDKETLPRSSNLLQCRTLNVRMPSSAKLQTSKPTSEVLLAFTRARPSRSPTIRWCMKVNSVDSKAWRLDWLEICNAPFRRRMLPSISLTPRVLASKRVCSLALPTVTKETSSLTVLLLNACPVNR